MIAFGSSITMPEIYDRCAGPGIRLAAEAESETFVHAAAGSIARSYNLVLDRARVHDDLEALVLVHQDAEIIDRDFCGKLRQALRDPDVAVVGCVGATGTRSIGWWEGVVNWGSTVYRYGELGGGETSWDGDALLGSEVDTVYGIMLALSPWAVRNVRFDESLGLVHGYDFDLCQQVRAAGRKVVSVDLEVVHHHSLELVADPETWANAHARVAEKWDDGGAPDFASTGVDWKQRARRAEAEAAAARLLAASRLLQAYAHAQHQEDLLEEVTASSSWRLTEPLRRLNARRRGRDAAA